MKNFKFKISEDDTFDSISKAVSDEALEMARDEMADRITQKPLHKGEADYIEIRCRYV